MGDFFMNSGVAKIFQQGEGGQSKGVKQPSGRGGGGCREVFENLCIKIA